MSITTDIMTDIIEYNLYIYKKNNKSRIRESEMRIRDANFCEHSTGFHLDEKCFLIRKIAYQKWQIVLYVILSIRFLWVFKLLN